MKMQVEMNSKRRLKTQKKNRKRQKNYIVKQLLMRLEPMRHKIKWIRPSLKSNQNLQLWLSKVKLRQILKSIYPNLKKRSLLQEQDPTPKQN
jgi:hypothetical protein